MMEKELEAEDLTREDGTHYPVGLQTHRFKHNPEEKRFADAWIRQNRYGSVLSYLLDVRPDRMGRPPMPADRDYVVAATVIQWLGSPVGQSFLQDLGYARAASNQGETE